MTDRLRIYRPSKAEVDHSTWLRQTVDLAREILRAPKPDTFLGRKTQEPFPKEKEAGE